MIPRWNKQGVPVAAVRAWRAGITVLGFVMWPTLPVVSGLVLRRAGLWWNWPPKLLLWIWHALLSVQLVVTGVIVGARWTKSWGVAAMVSWIVVALWSAYALAALSDLSACFLVSDGRYENLPNMIIEWTWLMGPFLVLGGACLGRYAANVRCVRSSASPSKPAHDRPNS